MLSQASAIVSATIEVYSAAMSSLLPTPAKSHYTFNLRDLARVVLGCTLVKKESVDNKRVFTRWVKGGGADGCVMEIKMRTAGLKIGFLERMAGWAMDVSTVLLGKQ